MSVNLLPFFISHLVVVSFFFKFRRQLVVNHIFFETIYKPRRLFWKGNEEPESIGDVLNSPFSYLPTKGPGIYPAS